MTQVKERNLTKMNRMVFNRPGRCPPNPNSANNISPQNRVEFFHFNVSIRKRSRKIFIL